MTRVNNPRTCYLTHRDSQQHGGNSCCRWGAGREAEECPCLGGEQHCNWKTTIFRGTMTIEAGHIESGICSTAPQASCCGGGEREAGMEGGMKIGRKAGGKR